mmetsp:Transcript_42002/g.101011  ORF Transcript_42002/g.101011 Transcript_42002/m.101011 type:complete len:230 (+) Transcript_42002:1852-2541(+)
MLAARQKIKMATIGWHSEHHPRLRQVVADSCLLFRRMGTLQPRHLCKQKSLRGEVPKCAWNRAHNSVRPVALAIKRVQLAIANIFHPFRKKSSSGHRSKDDHSLKLACRRWQRHRSSVPVGSKPKQKILPTIICVPSSREKVIRPAHHRIGIWSTLRSVAEDNRQRTKLPRVRKTGIVVPSKVHFAHDYPEIALPRLLVLINWLDMRVHEKMVLERCGHSPASSTTGHA